ncbi:MAG: TOTE conflict system archaeo-eukaryotic primase domain-containing protein [Lachnospiraceae bacterium]
MTREELEREVAAQRQEVHRLRELLAAHGISFVKDDAAEAPPVPKKNFPSREERERAQGERIRFPETITNAMIKGYFYCFHGRTDVFAKRSGKPSKKTGRYGYYPQCENIWKMNCPKREDPSFSCSKCSSQQYRRIEAKDILAHLLGRREDCSDVIGIYAIRKDDTCWFMVFDFDDHDLDSGQETQPGTEWMAEADALRTICTQNGIPCLMERSRSGNGAHIWLFFSEPVPAGEARAFGFALLAQGAKSVDLPSFRYYDRMIPNQDHLTGKGMGNLVALPLQGRALKKGNSAFVDENWDAYPDQWEVLRTAERVDKTLLREKTAEWEKEEAVTPSDVDEQQEEGTQKEKAETRVGIRNLIMHPQDAEGPVRLIRADRLYIGKENLKPALRNSLRSIATYWNPEYFANQARGFSNYQTPMIVYCGEETPEYIALPRGCREKVEKALDEAGIPYTEEDRRNTGKQIHAAFRGALYPVQKEAADALLAYDNGILAAATGFGKTVVGAWLIAAKKVNTLILVHNTEILEHWVQDLSQFLVLEEPLPTYETKSGRKKTRKSLIGTKQGQRNTMTGIVDVAMISSLGKPGSIDPVVKEYGMVIMDECHHGAAPTMDAVLREVNARFVYGMTATPKRDDKQERRALMQFGGIHWRYSAKERALAQNIGHYILPRFTPLVTADPEHTTLAKAEELMTQSSVRNELISRDVREAVEHGRTPIVVTQRVEHAKILAALLQDAAAHVYVLTGSRKKAEKEALREELHCVPDRESLILIATGQYIGEGFNFPRLDTMMLVMPISFEGNVEQYVGRLHRDYPGKREVWVYDYVDARLRIPESMYSKRLRTYKKMGYLVCGGPGARTEAGSYIYDADSCAQRFARDLEEARAEVLISSPGISGARVNDFIREVRPLLERGVRFYLVTLAPEIYPESARAKMHETVEKLQQAGISLRLCADMHEHFAVVDGRIVWYGTMNLLSGSRPEDDMMRVESEEIAAELLAEHHRQQTAGGEEDHVSEISQEKELARD